MASMYSGAGYHAQDSALLADGVAVFGPFSDNGAGLPEGNYDLSISMSIASLQAAAVRQYIGENGELMTGPLVVGNSIADGYHVSLDTTLQVK